MQIAVIGGSIGGLSAAIALLRNIKPEPRVTVFERSSHPLEDRGAGLAISLELYRQVTGDVDLEQLVYERGKYSRSEMLSLAGQVQGVDFVTPSDQPKNQWRGTVSYDNIMTALLAVYGTLGGEYVRGKRVLRVDLRDSQADIVFEDGATFRANLVVGCDGYMSDVRAQLLALYPPPVEAPVGSEDFRTLPPSSRPRYDGLLIFRGVLEQNLIPDGIYESILRPGCGNYNVFYDRAEKLYWGCYPIPAFRRSTDQRPRFNWFMYILRDAAAMERTLTDRHGTRHLFSLPPGHIAEDVQSEFLSFINRPDTLAKWPKVREIINLSAQLDKLFVQAVWSYSPHHVAFPSHNTILLGDAAALASPTTTTGTQRCFEDALALVEALKTGKGVKESLERTEEMRVKELRAIVERGIRRVSSIQPFYDALVKL